MNRIACFFYCLLGLLAASATCIAADRDNAVAQTKSFDLPRWELAWQDEFAANALDTTKWSRCKRSSSDWNNTMSDDPELLRIEEGVLCLSGVKNTDLEKDSAPYLTAGINSHGKFDFQYGKVQIRARFKSAQGAWPAIWMLGSQRGWPANGEIDLMEHLNFERRVYQTVHSEYTLNIDKIGKPKKTAVPKIRRDKWNTYGCEWDADNIVFTVNKKRTLKYPRVPKLGDKQWPFDQPFYLLLTMQIGGDWVNEAGATNADHYPASMEVDWVRVYKPKQTSKPKP